MATPSEEIPELNFSVNLPEGGWNYASQHGSKLSGTSWAEKSGQ
jgi:hypothetical protein